MHPNYIRKLFRDAQNKGSKKFSEEIIVTMNQKNSIPSKTRCIFSLHKLQLYRWFIDNSGKNCLQKKSLQILLSIRLKRKMWVKDWYTLLTDKFANVAMLDKQWFILRTEDEI